MIRRAAVNDKEVLLDMAKLMHAESPEYRDIPFVRDDFAFLLDGYLQEPTKAVFVAVDRESQKIIGMLGCFLAPELFNFSYQSACEIGIYVIPEKRGGLTGVRLIEQFEAWATEHQARRITIGESTGICPEIMDKLLTKRGYNMTSRVYEKEL